MSEISEELWAVVNKGTGEHCFLRKNYKIANEYFQASLILQPGKLDSVYLLTNSQAHEADLDKASKVLNENIKSNDFKNHFKCNLQECDISYEANNFEQSSLLVSNKMRHFLRKTSEIPHSSKTSQARADEAKHKGFKASELEHRFDMIQTNFDDTIGKNAGNCLFNQRKYFNKILRTWKPDERFKPPPMKSIILSKSDDCDIVSINEQIQEEKSVKEKHRLGVLKRKFAQSYMKSAWNDLAFINDLKMNTILKESNQNSESFSFINKTIDECIETTNTLTQQLYSRYPLYACKRRMFPNPQKQENEMRIGKYREMLKTRNEMFKALDEIKKCRKEGYLDKLIKIADHELSFHYQIKSTCLMPRKIEFTIEICNLIGLSHLDRLKLPENIENMTSFDILASVFEVKFSNQQAITPYVFGDQSTYRDPAEPDTSFLVFKNNVTRYENRLKHANLSIEKCHLYHEIGKQNLKQNKYEQVEYFARKIMMEADNARSYLWTFLGQILVVKADVVQKNVHKINQNLMTALKLVDRFENTYLHDVIALCEEISREFI
ncbi:CLUMA_CG020272, isoform A [Clunio marinus]|uniref:CLUMA_CG020272, isoform A n=1 Tax=Clunio marinus TaxID=568069 RepID=A0A1J1J4F9_9DIPT|nr:CLUMA_CG020272, isoform A [Clunio marinus]